MVFCQCTEVIGWTTDHDDRATCSACNGSLPVGGPHSKTEKRVVEILGEWRGGCSNAHADAPEGCADCTRAAMRAIAQAVRCP